MTSKKETIAKIRAMGAQASLSPYGEYRINIPKGKEATAYYTEEESDAIQTARIMMLQYKQRHTGGLFGSGLRGR